MRSIERFRQEVKLARRVTSPHVVRTFDVGVYGDDHFLTMEYIDGRSRSRWRGSSSRSPIRARIARCRMRSPRW